MQSELSFVELLDNLAGHFASDPIALLMALFGAVFVVAASAAFGYLTLGAMVDLLTPDVSDQSPRAGR